MDISDSINNQQWNNIEIVVIYSNYAPKFHNLY